MSAFDSVYTFFPTTWESFFHEDVINLVLFDIPKLLQVYSLNFLL